MDATRTEVATMKKRLACCLAGLALLLSSAPLSSQQVLPQLRPGQRVRLTVPSAGMDREIATVQGLSGDSLVLERRWAGQPLRTAVVLDSVQGLEVSRGKRGLDRPAARIGGLLGLSSGVAVGVWQFRCGGDQWCRLGKTFALAGEAIVGTFGGVVIGSLLAGAADTERWERVPPDALGRLRVGLAPLPAGRLGLGASVSF